MNIAVARFRADSEALLAALSGRGWDGSLLQLLATREVSLRALGRAIEAGQPVTGEEATALQELDARIGDLLRRQHEELKQELGAVRGGNRALASYQPQQSRAVYLDFQS
jgi:hypothetical protein